MKKLFLCALISIIMLTFISCSKQDEITDYDNNTAIMQSTPSEAIESFVKAMINGDKDTISELNKISTVYIYESDLYQYSYDYFQNNDISDFTIEETSSSSYGFIDSDVLYKVKSESFEATFGVNDIDAKYYINAIGNIYTK